jgi:hypothetical protein
MSGRATFAIARAALRGSFGVACMLAGCLLALAALVPPLVSAPTVALGICAAAGAAVVPARVAGLRDLRLLAAPLYGRELARALALAPNVALLACALGAMTIGASLLRALGTPEPAHAWTRFVVFAVAGVQTTLLALPGCLREGRERALYAAVAIVAGIAIAVLGARTTPVALASALLAAAAIGLTALRGLGETLARFDPPD